MTRILVVALLGIATVAASCARKGARRTGSSAVISTASLLPLPARVEWSNATFTLSPRTVIVAPGELEPLGQMVSAHIGLGVGTAPLRVETSHPAPTNGVIVLQRSATITAPEHYTLLVTPQAITITGSDLAGVFYGIQTLRQLLPPRFEYEALRPPADGADVVQVPAVTIDDGPRFRWRGAMLDVARHFFDVKDVKRYIDLIALHKLNRLHLHLADDQGWRLEIKSWPNLTLHGGSTEVGGTAGGYYTQAEYADIVQYAAARFITVVPEIDMPGHTNAALASYAELNCDGIARPLYTGIEVGFSALCVESETTYRFVTDVVREIAAITPGPYFHIGGDEVKTLTSDQYASFIARVQDIVRAHGKQVIGWDEIAATGRVAGTIIQHWRPNTTPAPALTSGASLIMSLADRAYLDMKYDEDTPIGLTWAAIIPIERAYDWDPANVAGVAPAAILGVEAPLWTETAADINDVEFLAFPRLAAIAEVGWTPQAARDWDQFRDRLARQAARWIALGINFYRSPEIDWRAD